MSTSPRGLQSPESPALGPCCHGPTLLLPPEVAGAWRAPRGGRETDAPRTGLTLAGGFRQQVLLNYPWCEVTQPT